MVDVTDATFQQEVIERSKAVPVVVDLWAEWCGPCKTLGPILERAVAETGGRVALVKIDVDSNPRASQTFKVQSIPAVYALRDGAIVDSFIGALPEPSVRAFVQRLAPPPSEVDQLVAAGDEPSLRQALELAPAEEKVVVPLAELLVERGATEEALALLARLPETAEVRRVAARARVGSAADDELIANLERLLDRVKADTAARQEFLDLLEVLGPDDPRTVDYRKALTARLY
ncbi:MAG TPA: tetratricopeptide repeat protein [Acidimicrobiales bacterium]|nr:tetratricopeptide repeat protein [Acidimicrobiales bacterium]